MKNGTSDEGSVTNVRVGEESAKKTRLPKKRILFPAIAIVLCVIAVLIIWVKPSHNKITEATTINTSKISSLTKSNSCSQSTLKSVSSEQPTQKDVNNSIELLSYEAGCQDKLGQYQQEIDTEGQLALYYQEEGNSQMVAVVNQEISDARYELTHKFQVYNGPPQADSSTLKYRESFND